jgi:segregation and condensation protein B
LEALLFVAEKPVPLRRLARALRRRSAEVRPVLSKLVEAYEDRGLYIVEVGGGFQFRTHPATADVVQKFLAQRPVRMSRAQMETLSIIAYRQPVTRPEVDEIRGVDTASSIKTLAERGFIKIIGRKDEPGRPLLYGTTDFFLEFFGLKALKDLPTLTEFSELTEESKDIFQRRTGEGIDLQAVAAAARQEEMDRAEEPDELDDDDLDDEPESEVSESEAPDVSVESGGDEEPEGSETSEERESEAGPDEELAD